jgi:hypothetical protein
LLPEVVLLWKGIISRTKEHSNGVAITFVYLLCIVVNCEGKPAIALIEIGQTGPMSETAALSIAIRRRSLAYTY